MLIKFFFGGMVVFICIMPCLLKRVPKTYESQELYSVPVLICQDLPSVLLSVGMPESF